MSVAGHSRFTIVSVVTEQPAQPAPCPVVPVATEHRDLRRVGHVAGSVDHECVSRGLVDGRCRWSRAGSEGERTLTLAAIAVLGTIEP